MKRRGGAKPAVNLLGVTPLDFSVTGSVEALKALLAVRGYPLVSCWAMGSTLEQLTRSGEADVNIVASYSGLAVAEVLQQKYGTPYVVGLPLGGELTERFCAALEAAAQGGGDQVIYRVAPHQSAPHTLVIGEAVSASSLRFALEAAGAGPVGVLCPLEARADLLDASDLRAAAEEEIAPLLEQAAVVIGDPLYQTVLRGWSGRFIALPHEAYSGRIFRRDIPVLIGEAFDGWYQKNFA